jgi:hypothetical protein
MPVDEDDRMDSFRHHLSLIHPGGCFLRKGGQPGQRSRSVFSMHRRAGACLTSIRLKRKVCAPNSQANAEWHQLLRMAAIANMMILDEYGIYDAEDSNDWLLLGIKGQLSEFELRGIRARMIGGQRSKALRGALKIPLPIGLVYTETDEVVKDPDRFIKQEIQLPGRGCGKASAVVYWSLPTHSHIRRNSSPQPQQFR